MESTHRGKRSVYSRCVSSAERIVSSNSFYDKRLCESVNTLTTGTISEMVAYEVGEVDPDAVKAYLQGVVLSDSLGRGITQRVVVEREWGWSR
jgi:hypothetical protein